jgi:hypothetical protein
MRIHERAGHATEQVYELPVEVAWLSWRAACNPGPRCLR